MRNAPKKLKALLHIERGVQEFLNGVEIWRLPHSRKFHRDHGPAVLQSDGSKEYYFEGKRHCLDGPAVSVMQGKVEQYWIYGKRISKIEFEAHILELKGKEVGSGKEEGDGAQD